MEADQKPLEPTPQEEIVAPKSSHKVFFFSLVGVFILCILLFTSYQLGQSRIASNQQTNFQPTPAASVSQEPTLSDPTANWKTYTNTKYRFSMKYPPEYQVKEEKSVTGLPYVYSIAIFMATSTGQTHVPNIGAYVYEKNNLTLRELYDLNKTTLFNNTINVKAGVINSINTLHFDEVPAELGIATSGRHVLFDGGKYAIDLTDVSEGTSENSILKPIYDQILSTFKFTDQSSADQVKICSNADVKISFYIPRSWTCDSKEHWITIKSDLYDINISNLGRGPYCSVPSAECVNTTFYSNDQITLTLRDCRQISLNALGMI